MKLLSLQGAYNTYNETKYIYIISRMFIAVGQYLLSELEHVSPMRDKFKK